MEVTEEGDLSLEVAKEGDLSVEVAEEGDLSVEDTKEGDTGNTMEAAKEGYLCLGIVFSRSVGLKEATWSKALCREAAWELAASR